MIGEIRIRVKELRKRKGFNQEDMAEAMGINADTYKNIERGKSNGNIETLRIIAEYHKVTIDYLVNGIDASYVEKMFLRLSVKKRNAAVETIKMMINAMMLEE